MVLKVGKRIKRYVCAEFLGIFPETEDFERLFYGHRVAFIGFFVETILEADGYPSKVYHKNKGTKIKRAAVFQVLMIHQLIHRINRSQEKDAIWECIDSDGENGMFPEEMYDFLEKAWDSIIDRFPFPGMGKRTTQDLWNSIKCSWGSKYRCPDTEIFNKFEGYKAYAEERAEQDALEKQRRERKDEIAEELAQMILYGYKDGTSDDAFEAQLKQLATENHAYKPHLRLWQREYR